MSLNALLSTAALLVVLSGTLSTSFAAEPDRVENTAAQITSEALQPNTPEYPLPLVAHWNTGTRPGGYSPAYQLSLITHGYHVLPWFEMPRPEAAEGIPPFSTYYETAIRRAAMLKLPISFVGTQWESLLTTWESYFGLPPDQNPNHVTADGKVLPRVSPFGPVNPWYDVGRQWTNTRLFRRLQELYPDPPLVIFVSNNEQPKLTWLTVEEDRRYVAQYGVGRPDEFRREKVSEGWIARYRALQAGMRDGLISPHWKERATFVGYDAFGPPHFGRWGDWKQYSLYTRSRIDPNPLFWDGGSVSFYVHNWNGSTDYTVWSPQIEGMNWVFMRTEALKDNPEFWFELSTWDGHEPSRQNDKRRIYLERGQQFTSDRYLGMVQFGMWLLRPRVVREFRMWTDTLASSESFFLPILAAAEKVYDDPALRVFWREGQLVPNRSRKHPYQASIPPEYQNVDRWFLLDTNLDPSRPWRPDTELPVFSLALVRNLEPDRQWLVYAHAPLGDRRKVTITIPGFGPIDTDVSVSGTFVLVDERTRVARPL